MRYLLIFQIFLSSLFSHGFGEEHLHLFSSLHVEYFILFVVGLLSTYVVYEKLFKGNR